MNIPHEMFFVGGAATMREAGSLKALRARQECYKELVDEAVLIVDNAALTKRHFG